MPYCINEPPSTHDSAFHFRQTQNQFSVGFLFRRRRPKAMKVFLLLPLLLASASANLRPFGGPEDAQQEAVSDDYALPPRLTRQPLVPSQYFLHRGRFGEKSHQRVNFKKYVKSPNSRNIWV